MAPGISFVMIRPDICEIAKELYWGRGRRPDAADNLAVELYSAAARDADVSLDIGAYTGIFTLISALANPKLHAHAFEIVPDVYEILFENCVRNDVLHQVTLHHVGIGRPGRIERFPADSIGSALPSFYSTRMTFESGVRVRLQSLDSVAALLEPGSKVIMKVDVEGTENEVFEHGQRFLAQFKPDILCEVLSGTAEPATLRKLLKPHGYRQYLVRDTGLTAESQLEPHQRFRDWFFTARDGERAGLLDEFGSESRRSE